MYKLNWLISASVSFMVIVFLLGLKTVIVYLLIGKLIMSLYILNE